jgi:peptide/nickel transport system substrate-binding protein
MIARLVGWLAVTAFALSGCESKTPCPRCDAIVIAAVSEPSTLLPPLVTETVGRDISDQVFERLADLAPGAAPIDSSAYQPRLAARWERVDSLTWRFHLRPGARWQDGHPLSAQDVAFAFEVFTDSVIDSPARPYLAGRVRIEAETPDRFLVRFASWYPEQLYDATYHVRIIPAHIWGAVPRASWTSDTSLARLVGSGPYRIASWERGQSLALEADSSARPRPKLGRAIWRFAKDPDAALNLVLAHEADLLETVGSWDRAARVRADSELRVVEYPSATYGFLGFNLGSARSPHPLFASRGLRRALASALDRSTLARTEFGPDAKAPPGPMSQLLWIWSDQIVTLPHDTAAAGRALDGAGWRRGPDGVRRRGDRPLAFDILVPSTSGPRRRMAEAIQETWRAAGARVTVTAVDFPVFMARLGQGKFDSYLGAWLDEPSPRGLADQWTTAGVGLLNYGQYRSHAFDSLFARAVALGSVERARAAWREAMDTLNADAPAIFLYAPSNLAAASRRIEGLRIDPFSWASGLPTWSLTR